MKSFIKGRIRSVKFAVKGFFLLFRTEHAIISQLFVAILMTFVGFYFDITRTEWMLQIILLGGIMIAEGLNTAVEKICDFIHPDYHKEIGTIKDISAGAVTIAAVVAAIVGGIIYYPYIIG